MSKFLAGALVGVVVGMMIAPEKGEDFREHLGERVDGLRRRINKLRGEANDKLEELRDMLGNEVEGLTYEARQQILGILEESRSKSQQLSSEL